MNYSSWRLAWAAALVGLMLPIGSGRADADMIFTFVFDNGGLSEAPPAKPPYVGAGTVTIGNDPGNGTFLLSSLGTFAASFTFGADQFATSDIKTPLSQVEVVLTPTLTGQLIQFSNTNSFGTGPESGSIDFINAAGAVLTFEPPGFGGINLYQEFGPNGVGGFAGNYSGPSLLMPQAVPEPAAWALALIGGLAAVGGGWRRWSRQRAATRFAA